MSNFEAKKHQIRSESLQRSPDPLAGFKGDLLLRRGGGEGEGREEEVEGIEGRRGIRGGEGGEAERGRGLFHQSKSTKICPGVSKTVDAPAVVSGDEAPTGTGCVSQSRDNNGSVYVVCSAASFRP